MEVEITSTRNVAGIKITDDMFIYDGTYTTDVSDVNFIEFNCSVNKCNTEDSSANITNDTYVGYISYSHPMTDVNGQGSFNISVNDEYMSEILTRVMNILAEVKNKVIA